MDIDGGFFPTKSLRLYSEENAIGFVCKNEEWALRFYLETVMRQATTVELKSSEVIFYLKQAH